MKKRRQVHLSDGESEPDPMRLPNAGYEVAEECARESGLKLPMV